MSDPLSDLLAPLRDSITASPIPPVDGLRRISARRRARQRYAAAMSLLAVLTTIGLVTRSTPHRQGVVSTAGSVPTPPSLHFIPPTTVAPDGRVQVLLTQLDGTQLALTYPNSLHLAELGLTPGGAILWTVRDPSPTSGLNGCCGRTLDIRHGSVSDYFAGRMPTKQFTASDGTVSSYYTSTNNSLAYLVVPIRDWVVLVYDYPDEPKYAQSRMTDSELAAYAQDLTGHVTAEGYLVLTPTPPLVLGHADVPDLSFGGGGAQILDVLDRPCPPSATPSVNKSLDLIQQDATGTWLCSPTRNVTIHVSGPGLQHAVLRDLTVG